MRFFFILIAAALLPAFLHAQIPKKMNVAVLEFQRTGSVTQDDALTLTNRFRGILVETNAFEVVEREKMKDILKEQDFVLSDACNNTECAVQVGQLLGVEAMIAGDIGKVGLTYTIDLRLIDVRTGSIIQAKRQDHKGEIDGLLDVMSVIAQGFAAAQKQNDEEALKLSQKKINKLWFIAGGAVLVGGAYLILGKKSSANGIAGTGLYGASFPADP